MSKNRYIWDDMAKSFHRLSSRSKAHMDKYRKIANIIMDTNPNNILDLGCGSGILENELIKLGYKGEICAVDSSTEMLKIAKLLCGDRVAFSQMDFDKEIKINEKYEVIVVINVLFFLKDKINFLKNIKNLLEDSQSFLILVNPKPKKEANNWQFIKAHYSDTNFTEKILITINELINIPRYFRMIRGQSYLDKMAKRGQITFDKKNDIINMFNKANLKVKVAEDIHAGQNWLFVTECE